LIDYDVITGQHCGYGSSDGIRLSSSTAWHHRYECPRRSIRFTRCYRVGADKQRHSCHCSSDECNVLIIPM
jgi:hypothetical protein